jgi:hypothetical protein
MKWWLWVLPFKVGNGCCYGMGKRVLGRNEQKGSAGIGGQGDCHPRWERVAWASVFCAEK